MELWLFVIGNVNLGFKAPNKPEGLLYWPTDNKGLEKGRVKDQLSKGTTWTSLDLSHTWL